MKPIRIQLSRKKGFSLHDLSMKYNGLDCVRVDRANRYWGNPFVVGKHGSVGECLDSYRAFLAEGERTYPELFAQKLSELRDKNLACWCKSTDPCHADILLELANKTPA